LKNEKSRNPKLIRMSEWGFEGEAPSSRRQGALGAEPRALV